MQDFGHLGAQHGFIHLQLGSRRLQVDGPLNGVGNRGDGRHHGADHLRALHGVVARLVGEQLGLELQEILCVLVNGAVQRVAAHLLGVGVRVVAVGQKHHLHGHALGEQHVDAPQRSPNACRVPVENDRDVLGESADEVDLARGEGGATGRDHVGHPRLVHRHHVGVALHQEAPLLLDDGGLGKVHAVQDPALVVEGALGRVEILGDLLVRGQRAAPKSNDPARHIPNREHDPALEEIPQRSVLALLAQACLDQLLGGVSCFLRCCGQGVPRIGAVANQERVEDVVPESALHEITAADGLAGIGVAHLVHEPLGRPTHEVGEAFLGGSRRDFLGGALLLLHLDVVPTGQHAQRFRIARLFQFHEERHDAAPLATRETFENALGRQHVKRRRLLVGERAEPAHRTPRFFQLHVVAHHLFDDGGVHDLVDGFLRNHGVEMTRGGLTKIPKFLRTP